MNSDVLNSWKEISQYVGRGVRTVQRWERECRLPVHRPRNHPRSPVIAIPAELDDWLRNAGLKKARQNGCPDSLRLQLQHIIAELWANAERVQRNGELLSQRVEELRKSTTPGLSATVTSPDERPTTLYRRTTIQDPHHAA